MLFENEVMNITKLHKVICYHPAKRDKYKGCLPTYELILYVEGESTISFHGKKYKMEAERLLYLPKGLDNTDYSLCVHKDVTLYNIYFDTDLPLPDHPMQFTLKTGEIKQLYEKLYRTWVAKGENYYYKSIRYVYKIFELLRRQQLAAPRSKASSRLEASEEYLRAHYCDKQFDYAELNRRSGLSYSYFKKLFIQKYGLSPVRQVNRMRIDKACELLETGRYTVGKIAELCGFENTYYFSTVFKNHIGVSPKNYIKKGL